MCWVFSQTVSVTSLQCSEMLPGPFPARFSCRWWLRGEEVGAFKPGRAMPCSLLVPCPVTMTSSALVFSSWSLSSCRLFPSALCLVDVTCFYLSISGEAGLAVTALSTAAVVSGRSITQNSPVPLTLCVSAPSTALLPACLCHHLALRWSSPSVKLGWVWCQAITSKCAWQHFEKL